MRLTNYFYRRDASIRYKRQLFLIWPTKERSSIVTKGTLLATRNKDMNFETKARQSYGVIQELPRSSKYRKSYPHRKTDISPHDGLEDEPHCVKWFFRAGDTISHEMVKTIPGIRYIWLVNGQSRAHDIEERIAWSNEKLPEEITFNDDTIGGKGLITITLSEEELKNFPIEASSSGRPYHYVEYRVRLRCSQLRLIFEFIVPRSGVFVKPMLTKRSGDVQEPEQERDLIIKRAQIFAPAVSELGLQKRSNERVGETTPNAS
ncbi:MAG: hypothetical protein Q9160_003375 [Pyrenula sp. 1 TL-2023]